MRAEGYSSWFVGMYVCVSALICRLTHWNHKREIPTDSSQYRNHFKLPIFLKMCRSKVMAEFAHLELVLKPIADHVKKTDHARIAHYARIVLNKRGGEYSSPSPPLFLTPSPSLALQ